MICRHLAAKPIADREGIIQSPGAGFRFSAGEKAYCTQPNSLRLPGSLVVVICEGAVEKCDITLAGG